MGNDGSHQLGRPITTGTGAPPDVLAALVAASDHLPVVATYEWGFRPGDTNGDWRFDQWDIIQVLNGGKYLTGEHAAWSEGDWTADGLFDPRDLVAGLAEWGGQWGDATVPVPEPATIVLARAGRLAATTRLAWSERHMVPNRNLYFRLCRWAF